MADARILAAAERFRRRPTATLAELVRVAEALMLAGRLRAAYEALALAEQLDFDDGEGAQLRAAFGCLAAVAEARAAVARRLYGEVVADA